MRPLLLDRCRLFFKRELPVDGWRVFANTMIPRLPRLRFRSNSANLARLAKLRPISLGIPPGIEAMLPDRPRDKTVDVFFAGDPRGLPARENVLAELERLRGKGSSSTCPSVAWTARSSTTLRRRPPGVVARRLSAGTASGTTRRPPAVRCR